MPSSLAGACLFPTPGDTEGMRRFGEQFDRDRFRSAHAIGTQVGLAGSMAGVRAFLEDLAAVTTPDATAVLVNDAPDRAAASDVFASRPDPAAGLAHRVFHWSTRVMSAGRCCFTCSASTDCGTTADTPWEGLATRHGETQWRAALGKNQHG